MADNVSLELLSKQMDQMLKRLGTVEAAVLRIDARTASMDSYLAGLHSSMNWQSAELDQHRGRLEALENPTTDEPSP